MSIAFNIIYWQIQLIAHKKSPAQVLVIRPIDFAKMEFPEIRKTPRYTDFCDIYLLQIQLRRIFAVKQIKNIWLGGEIFHNHLVVIFRKLINSRDGFSEPTLPVATVLEG